MTPSPSVNTMAFRGGQNRNRNFGGNYGGGNRGGMNPWDGQGGGNYGGGMGGGRQGGGQGMNAEALSLANNLLNNLLRNPNPPSLLDLPRGGGGMGGNRNRQMGNRVGGGGNGNRNINNNNRRQGGANRGNQKPGNKQSSGGVRNKQNALDRAKKLLAKNSNKKKDSTSGENAKNIESQSPYADVPNDMFYCHLCKKHMWDAISFENHIKGRTHLMMREGIEESYRLKANMIRQEAKIAETLKSIELDRLKRMGKSGKRGMMEYCTMCDLSFHGHLSTHRKSDGHLQLKKFLHPKCSECIKEFPTRIEYDTHLLSPEHLKKAAEKNTKVGDRKLLQSLQILTEEEELKDVRPPQKRKKKVVKKEEEGGEKKEGEEGAEGEKKENGEGGEEVKKEEDAEEEGDHEHDETKEGDQTMEEGKEDEYEEVPLPVDPEDCILDFDEETDIPTEVEAKLPKYNWTRPVGAKLIKRLECIECRLCGRFFDNEKTAEVHTRTVYHHRNFLKFITEKSADSKIAQKRAAAAAEEVERKKKRLEEAEAAEKETTEGGEAATGEEGGDLYDPSEATGDDEDVDMAANGEQNGETAANETPVKEEPVAEAEKMEDEPVVPAAEVKTEEAVEQPQAPEPPVISESPTPAPAATPAKRAAAAKATTTPRSTPARNRGRGRYNRY